jgi:eukaryotic-like serine/threonine-protein kinase
VITNLLPGDPKEVGPYRLLGRLGQGGMGVVYLARSPGGRQVAVKVIRPEYANEPGFRARFTREVTSARGVSGMFTALVVDADTNCPTPWFATAYVPGQSLYEAVETSGPLPAPTVLQLAAGLAEGLQAIHAAGVIHRDLKPSNVLLAADGPRVIDFGISKAREASMLTQTGMVMGSPGYLSPEQAEGIEVGPPSDIFSLGGVLVYAITGVGPFGSGPTPALMFRVVSRDPDLTRVPDLMLPIIKQCLIKDPALRPTPGELLVELDDLGAGVGVVTPEWLPDAVTSQIARYVPTALTPATPARPNVTTSDAAVASGTTSDSAAPVADTPAVAGSELAGAGLAGAGLAGAALAGAGLAGALTGEDDLAAAAAGATAGSGGIPLTPAGIEVASAVDAPELAEAGVASDAIAGAAQPEPAFAGVDTAAMASTDLADAGLEPAGDAPVTRVDAAAGLAAAAAIAAADAAASPPAVRPVADLAGTPGAGDHHDLTFLAPAAGLAAAGLAADVGGLATIGLASARSSAGTPVVGGPVPVVEGPVPGGPGTGGPGAGGPASGGPFTSGAGTGGPGGPGGTVTPLRPGNRRRLILAAAAAIVILAGVGVGAGLGLASGGGTGKATGGPTPSPFASKSVSASPSHTHTTAAKATTKAITKKKKTTKKVKPAGHTVSPTTPSYSTTYYSPTPTYSTYYSPTPPPPSPKPTPTPTHTTAAPPPNQIAEGSGGASSTACGADASESGGSAATFSVSNQTSAPVYVAMYSTGGAYVGEGEVGAYGSAGYSTYSGYVWVVNNYAQACIGEFDLTSSGGATVVS